MKNALLALIAIGAGALASDWSARLPVVHEVAGQIFQRGKLIAVVGQRGVFEADLGARLREKQFCAGREDSDEAERVALREELIAGEALPTNAVTTNESERALVALRNQFADDRQFRVALQHSGVSQRTLRRALAEAIRGEAWIENQIAAQVAVSDAEIQNEFAPDTFFWLRLRAQPPSSCKRSNARSWMSPCVWAGGRILANSLPQFPKMKRAKRTVAISVFSRPLGCRQNFSRPRNNCCPMLLHDFCNRI